MVFVQIQNKMGFAAIMSSFFSQIWDALSFRLKMRDCHLPSWARSAIFYLKRLLSTFMLAVLCPPVPVLSKMEERPQRLEALKTLHETRANDQYGECSLSLGCVLRLMTLQWRLWFSRFLKNSLPKPQC